MRTAVLNRNASVQACAHRQDSSPRFFFSQEYSDNFSKLRPIKFLFLIQTLLVTRFALEKRLHSCSRSHLFSQGNTDAHAALCNNYRNDISLVRPLEPESTRSERKKQKQKKSAVTNNTTPTLCANASRVGVYVCVRCVCTGVLREMVGGELRWGLFAERAAAARFSINFKGRRGPTKTEGGVMAEVNILRSFLRQICL